MLTGWISPRGGSGAIFCGRILAENADRFGPGYARAAFIRAGNVTGKLRAAVTVGIARHNTPGVLTVGKASNLESKGVGCVIRVIYATCITAGNLASGKARVCKSIVAVL